ncbi:hypothetical protein Salat_2726800 [Sesamum alatum]|uniref:Uncharacterized protein n=1 Tax=Sesamum alatum TaxID=300844 RepID=A0AAE1XKJ9_9LAMI|nr:hypothetical protein Salat_2726800 [Sesamum alatum]
MRSARAQTPWRHRPCVRARVRPLQPRVWVRRRPIRWLGARASLPVCALARPAACLRPGRASAWMAARSLRIWLGGCAQASPACERLPSLCSRLRAASLWLVGVRRVSILSFNFHPRFPRKTENTNDIIITQIKKQENDML